MHEKNGIEIEILQGTMIRLRISLDMIKKRLHNMKIILNQKTTVPMSNVRRLYFINYGAFFHSFYQECTI